MTIKEASIKFNVDKSIIKKSIEGGMLPKRKIGRFCDIPDDTKFIPVKSEIQYFLFQILKFKNDGNKGISRKLCPNAESLNILFEYLYNN